MCEEDKKEIERLKAGVYAIVAGLVNKKPCTTLALARTVMYGGSVLSALDIDKLGHKYGRKPDVKKKKRFSWR